MMITKISNFLNEMINFHGFSSNTKTGFSCYIPDPDPFDKKEGMLLWVCTPKGERIITKLDRLVSESRKNRLMKLKISKTDYIEKFIPGIIEYSNILVSEFGFESIGKGVSTNLKSNIFNLSLELSHFSNNLKLLREFEIFLTNNPITLFANENIFFETKKKNQILYDRYFKYII